MHFPFETLFSFESGSTPLSNEVFTLHLILSKHLLISILALLRLQIGVTSEGQPQAAKVGFCLAKEQVILHQGRFWIF